MDYSRIHSITMVHEDLELLVSSWSVESHMLLPEKEFGPTLEDVLNLMTLPLYRETNSMSLTFKGEDEDKLQQLTVAIGHSSAISSSKSTYASWISYFDEGKRSDGGLVLEALIAY